MADDQSALLVEIGVTQARMERELAKVVKQGVVSAQQIEKSFGAANSNIVAGAAKLGPAFQRGTAPATAAVKNTSGAVSNLTSQLNDIGVQLAGGQSPFLIMLQQGTQISQLFTQTGTTIKGFGGILANAAMSALNPFSLLTFAVIGLGGAAVQYFASWLTEGDMTTKEIEKQEAAIQKVVSRLGEAAPALSKYADELKRAADERERLAAYDVSKESVGTELRKQFDALTESQTNAISLVPDASREYGVLASKLASGVHEAADFQRVIDALNDAISKTPLGAPLSKELQDAVKALMAMREASADAKQQTADLTKEQTTLNLSLDEGKTVVAGLASQFLGLGQEGGGAIQNLATTLTKDLIPKITKAVDEIDRLTDNFEKLQSQIKKSPLGTLPPLFAGGGKFMNEEEARNFDFRENQLREAGGSSAAQGIKGYEGFRTNAYKDNDGKYRVGYGSDTATRANGMIEKVTAQTVVTLDDAERDLSRRILEFQSGVQDAIGSDTWRSLSEGQQAALTSIAYNYGSLPKRIVAAIQSGGGPEVVAKAIDALSTDNGGINAKRRKNEAQQYLTGTGITAADAGISTGKERGATSYKDEVQAIKERTMSLRESTSAQAALNPMVKDYGYALEKAKAEQRLLADAERQKLTITPELRKEIDTLAAAYAEASAGAKRLDASQATIRENAQKWAGIEKDVFGGFLKDIKDGVKASEALGNALQRLGDKLLDAGLDALFDPKAGVGGGGGILGSLFSGIGKIFGFASGTSNTGGRPGQPRGVVHGQEAVIPMADGDIPVKISQPDVKETRRQASRDTVDIRLADDSGRMASVADQRIQTASGTIVRVATETAYKTVKKDMANLMSDAQARN